MAGGIDPDSIMIIFNALPTRANTKRDWSRSWKDQVKPWFENQILCFTFLLP